MRVSERSETSVELLTREFEEAWGKTWATEKGQPPSHEELAAHPQYEATLKAWLEGHGIKSSN